MQQIATFAYPASDVFVFEWLFVLHNCVEQTTLTTSFRSRNRPATSTPRRANGEFIYYTCASRINGCARRSFKRFYRETVTGVANSKNLATTAGPCQKPPCHNTLDGFFGRTCRRPAKFEGARRTLRST